MLHLLQLEWKKLITNRTFVIMSSMYLILLPAIFLSIKLLMPDIDDTDFNGLGAAAKQALTENPFMFPDVWRSYGYIGSWFNYYSLGVIGILIITMEYNYKTMRQSIINGLTRTEFYLSKIVMVIGISLGFALYFCVTGLIIGFTNTGSLEFSKLMSRVTLHADIIPFYIVQILGYVSFACLIGWIFKRFALSIIFFCAYPLLELIVKWSLIGWVKLKSKLVLFLPINAMEDLIPIYFPISAANAGFEETKAEFAREVGMPYLLEPIEALSASIFFIILFFFIGYKIFMRSDL